MQNSLCLYVHTLWRSLWWWEIKQSTQLRDFLILIPVRHLLPVSNIIFYDMLSRVLKHFPTKKNPSQMFTLTVPVKPSAQEE